MVRWLMRSAMVSLMPATPDLPGVEDCDPDGFLQQLAEEAPFRLRLGIFAGALLFHALPLFVVFVPLPAFLLPAGLRDRYAMKVASHPLYLVRQLIFLVKFAGGLCWGRDPAVRARLALPAYPQDPGSWRTS